MAQREIKIQRIYTPACVESHGKSRVPHYHSFWPPKRMSITNKDKSLSLLVFLCSVEHNCSYRPSVKRDKRNLKVPADVSAIEWSTNPSLAWIGRHKSAILSVTLLLCGHTVEASSCLGVVLMFKHFLMQHRTCKIKSSTSSDGQPLKQWSVLTLEEKLVLLDQVRHGLPVSFLVPF